MENKTDTQKALEVLIQAVQIAQQKGAYTLQDARLIAEAVEVFVPKQDKVETKVEVEEETEDEE